MARHISYGWISKIRKEIRIALLILATSFLFLACSQNCQRIFDGMTFQGWEGSKEFFRIEDGSIVAGALDREIPTNKFLCTEKEYDDFDLCMKVKFTSKENNAGIQFRTSRIPDHHEVIGYQADVGYTHAGAVWGSLYDESRRKKFVAEASQDKILEVLNENGWNDYRIRCEGAHVQFWLNGEHVLEYTEEDDSIPQTGVICVQIHGGKPAEAWYKDIFIKEL